MGEVTLVGAGCGRDLITVKGLAAIKAADVIVYDDLIDNHLLSSAKETAELIYAGKRDGAHSEKQEKINELLAEKALGGKNVVRLKGGDSFVFGRGGEEILFLKEKNIPVSVIPGVTSAVAVPENMGIPVTHRGVSQSFTVVTGHTAAQTDEDYKALAMLKGTLVFLMGLHNIENICKKLIENGKGADTPAAVLSQGFSQKERRIDSTLENIAEKARGADTPAVLVVGKTAEFDFRKTAEKPLSGVCVTVTGTKDFAAGLAEKLAARGAFVNICPNLEIKAKTDEIPRDFGAYTYLVFTSSNGVRIFFKYLKEKRIDFRKICRVKFACIGAGSAKTLEEYGFGADFIPQEYTAKSLGKELAKVLSAKDRLLILRAENASAQLTSELSKAHVKYDDIKIHTAAPVSKTINTDAHYITFASARGVCAFFENGGSLNSAVPVCIGEITAAEFRKHSKKPPLVAASHTADGIISSILGDKNETLQKTQTK